jgi:hypothetical protein
MHVPNGRNVSNWSVWCEAHGLEVGWAGLHAQVLIWWERKDDALFHLETLPYSLHAAPAFAGDFPWVEGSANACVTSAHRHYAQRYRYARAQHHRSLEERTILHAEVVRLFNGLEEREDALRSYLEQQRSSGAVGAGNSSAATDAASSSAAAGAAGSSAGAGGTDGLWPNVLAAGKAKMLEIDLSRLQLIHAEASKLLSKYLPKQTQ